MPSQFQLHFRSSVELVNRLLATLPLSPCSLLFFFLSEIRPFVRPSYSRLACPNLFDHKTIDVQLTHLFASLSERRIYPPPLTSISKRWTRTADRWVMGHEMCGVDEGASYRAIYMYSVCPFSPSSLSPSSTYTAHLAVLSVLSVHRPSDPIKMRPRSLQMRLTRATADLLLGRDSAVEICGISPPFSSFSSSLSLAISLAFASSTDCPSVYSQFPAIFSF